MTPGIPDAEGYGDGTVAPPIIQHTTMWRNGETVPCGTTWNGTVLLCQRCEARRRSAKTQEASR